MLIFIIISIFILFYPILAYRILSHLILSRSFFFPYFHHCLYPVLVLAYLYFWIVLPYLNPDFDLNLNLYLIFYLYLHLTMPYMILCVLSYILSYLILSTPLLSHLFLSCSILSNLTASHFILLEQSWSAVSSNQIQICQHPPEARQRFHCR